VLWRRHNEETKAFGETERREEAIEKDRKGGYTTGGFSFGYSGVGLCQRKDM
jgi:hypothetical protein